MRVLVFILFLMAMHVNAGTIRVGKNGSQQTIKAALTRAESGDTILVESGVYKEGNILINKPVFLIGIDFPVLDGELKYEVLTVQSHHVTISGFKIINTGNASLHDVAGISIVDARHVNVFNNILENTFFGIHATNSKDIVIENNQLTSFTYEEHEIGNGIHLWKCQRALINKNTVTSHRDGIYLEFTTHSTISNNVSEKSKRYGLHFMFSHDDEYRGNQFINNGAGVAVMYTENVTMVNNRFVHNWGSAAYGLLLKEIQDSRVEQNVFDTNSVGIFMEGTSRIKFNRNEFLKNGYAVKLQASCDDNIFSRNNFIGNTFDITTNGTLVLNQLDHNYWDKYDGYDLKKDGIGDVPFHPVSMYAMIVERVPSSVLLWHSFLVFLMDKAERVIPAMTPENMKDESPTMKPNDLLQASN